MASSSSRTQRSCATAAFASTANVRVHDDHHRVRFFSVEQIPEEFPGRRSTTVTSSKSSSSEKRTCMCSPTTHPGSFRCAYHKQLAEKQKEQKQLAEKQKELAEKQKEQKQTASLSGSRKLNLLRSAMKNSFVRIGGVEAELVRRVFATLIRPSSHHLRRRDAFRPKPTRFSLMSKAQAQAQTQDA